ncbi:MAG: hypothetical protein ACRDJW_00750 [Thermomicrobiales bacterium]
MVAATRIVTVEPNSEVARLIDEAGDRPLVLITNGRRYRLEREETENDDPWANYDPDKLMEGMLAAAGSISEEEGERMKAYIYAAREAGTRPPDRP